jgi:hypothetical protein
MHLYGRTVGIPRKGNMAYEPHWVQIVPTHFWVPFGKNKRVATLEILSVRNPCAPTESEIPRRSRSGFAVSMGMGSLGKCSRIFLAASKPLSAGIEMSRTAKLGVYGSGFMWRGFRANKTSPLVYSDGKGRLALPVYFLASNVGRKYLPT